MALVHDIVEIDAGDTFAYDEAEGAADQGRPRGSRRRPAVRPAAAATGRRRLRGLWDEYERGDTPEARFVMAVDRLAPMMLNLAEGGTTWREHGITRARSWRATARTSSRSLPGAWAAVLAPARRRRRRRPAFADPSDAPNLPRV